MGLFKRSKNNNKPLIQQIISLIPNWMLVSTVARYKSDKGLANLSFNKGTIIIEDKGYYDFSLMLSRIQAENVFVTRIKNNACFEDGVVTFKLANTETPFLPDYFGKGSYHSTMDSLVSKYGITKIERAIKNPNLLRSQRVYDVYFSDIQEVDSLVADLQKYSFMEWAEKVPIIEFFGTPDDPKLSLQYALNRIMADSIWLRECTSAE